MPALFISVMRTAVPLVAGWLISLALWAGLDLSDEQVTTAVTAVVTFLYYLAFRLLERLGERLRGSTLQTVAGWFLGWARPPAYPTCPSAAPAGERPGPVAI
ncbi:hypothetical protein [Streptomyces sp. UH6]|uniref:hypothetical protein n=1 Tax=Streptomyces sp. UH6 TaxID=2748379 RepID=UPI0015D4B171|nr:hypothetical protein [Streptomyces sp. UH6]NYV73173.1 hypothetical protein [Streptomyces sp. UH6]